MKKVTILLLGVCLCFFSTIKAQTDGETSKYSNGAFIVNEDWYGHQNSTVNWISDEGEWTYRVFQQENPGMELGGTNSFGSIYGDKFYFVAKQEKDPGATITGGRFVVCDAKTLQCLKQFEVISTKDGASDADGRSFLGVNEHKGYISTNNGIYIYDIDRMEIIGQIPDSGNPEEEGYGSLYRGQTGTMVRVNEKVFAVHQSAGILVIDPETDEIIRTVQAPEEMDTDANGNLAPIRRGFGSIVLSKDGNLWVSVAKDQSGSGNTVPYIYRLDPVTCDTVRIAIPEGFYSPSNSWYAWTPDCFCSSTQNNVIYWNGGPDSWFNKAIIVKYDIDKNEFSNYIDLSNTMWRIYGASFRIDPVTDEAYVSLCHTGEDGTGNFGDPTFILRIYDNAGNQVDEYSMISNYWFPSLPVFPDNKMPVFTEMPLQTGGYAPFTVSFKEAVADPDNMKSAIIKTIIAVSDESLFTAEIVDGNLKIIPVGKPGEGSVTLKFNSNGKIIEGTVPIKIDPAVQLKQEKIRRYACLKNRTLVIENCEDFDFALYNGNGQLIKTFHTDHSHYVMPCNLPTGIYILKGNNGKEILLFKLTS